MCPAAVIPQGVTSPEEDLQGFADKYIMLWHSSTADNPALAVTYTAADQHANEREASLLIDSMDDELRNYPEREPEQSEWRERMFASLRRFGTQSFRFPDRHFDIIFSREYFAVTRAFARKARAFDARIEASPLAQAMRNVWVINCLQMFLGGRPSLSPSAFAYSMLYPYTDNYLDRPELPIQAKEMACRRLGLRLSGQSIEPLDAHEAAVFRLVKMIEGEFPRAVFPEVYSSLLAIHGGQVRSLDQQHKSFPGEEQLLRISVEKGGASVLADGWLVSGSLGREEADFFFGFGVMLQLLDDLQDLPEDRVAGHWTLFTRRAELGRLDCLANRLWAFIHRVLDSPCCFTGPHGVELKDLMRRSGTTLMLRAIAESPDMFSSEYLDRMQQGSPLSFAFLRDSGKEIKARFRKIWPGLARRRKLRSIFDLLG